jgi:DHA2 family multidrug resistance protein-like MFS transporter
METTGPAAMQDVSELAPRATRREWIGLGIIALPCMIYSMDLTVLFLAVPSLTADLNPSSTQLLWISDIYGFMVAGALIPMGTLGDRIGRRKLLLMGAALFAAASVLAAFAPTAEMLIATRALLGIAGATVAPSTLSLIRNMFPNPEQRTFAIGMWVTAYSVGAVVAPLLGGLLLEFFWWGSVFLLAVPVMLLLLVVGPKLLPEFKDPNPGPVDFTSAAMSLTAVLAVIYGLKRVAVEGVTPVAVATVLGGIAVGVVFVRRQHGLAHPFLDLRLFRVPAFSAALGTYMASVFILFGVSLLIAQYLQLVLGLSPMRAGAWTLPSAAGFIVGSMTAPALVRRVKPAYIMGGALLISAMGFVLLTQLSATSGLWIVVVGTVTMSIAIAPVVTLATDFVVGAAPPERAGAASAISETSAEFGGALSIAVLGSIATAGYRAFMIDAGPTTVAPEALDAARETLGGAIVAAQALGGSAGDALLASAREAYVRAVSITTTICAVLAAITGVVSAIALRDERARTGEEHAAT